ncbi:hypothetical protein [Polaromonas sp.]|uniref:hypothetical protein n=1 Tax=Polaromonas sp. TaxID=1869339 RepID=UPI003568F6D6
MTVAPKPETLPARASQDVFQEESARYALLRRIAPALRHHLAGTMQPIGMVSAIMERRLQAEQPDLGVLRDNSKSISTLSRSAASAGMNLITWIAPKENGIVSLQAGVEECVGMLGTDLAFRGFTVANNITAATMSTPISGLRNVFTAALIALTDTALVPASIEISSEPADGHTLVLITVSSEPGATPPENPRAYRKLGWADVGALANAEQVGLVHEAGRAEMRFAAVQDADVTV